jgi:hypothetical protein
MIKYFLCILKSSKDSIKHTSKAEEQALYASKASKLSLMNSGPYPKGSRRTLAKSLYLEW